MVFAFVASYYSAWAQPATPRQMYKELFKAVQMQSVFPDGKTFVDCTAKISPTEILQKYQAQSKTPGFDLKDFVLRYFALPVTRSDSFHSDTSADVDDHINKLWDILSRPPDTFRDYSSLLPLPYPYIVPGGRFREIYYWDSYFTMLGLQVSGKKDMIENMVRNFAYLINQYGFIPNGNRSYYLTRSQPPFFSLMVDMLAQEKGKQIYKTYQPILLKEYAFWMKGLGNLRPGESCGHVVKMPDGSVLNRYYDAGDWPREESWKADLTMARKSDQPPKQFYRNVRSAAESGWDFSSRWFADGRELSTIHTTGIIPVDLNCLLYHLEKTIAASYLLMADPSEARVYEQKADQRKRAIYRFCWNKQKNFFCDYLIGKKKVSGALTLAGMFPLFFGIAGNADAIKVAQLIKVKFLKSGGVVTSLKNTGQQWDAPNGWAPLEYITVEGLRRYGCDSLARAIGLRWIDLNVRVYKHTGKLMEKYNVEDPGLAGGGGEYTLQDGFGWTNGVLMKLIQQYKKNG